MASLITRVDTLELFLVGSFEKQNVLAETMHYLKARIRTEMRFFFPSNYIVVAIKKMT
jgi:hypothetical protein